MPKYKAKYVLRHKLNHTAFWDEKHGWVMPERQYTRDERETLTAPPNSVWLITLEE